MKTEQAIRRAVELFGPNGCAFVGTVCMQVDGVVHDVLTHGVGFCRSEKSVVEVMGWGPDWETAISRAIAKLESETTKCQE